MKPHIRYDLQHKAWECADQLAKGYGLTWRDAWYVWQRISAYERKRLLPHEFTGKAEEIYWTAFPEFPNKGK